jgi:hypothetical protein
VAWGNPWLGFQPSLLVGRASSKVIGLTYVRPGGLSEGSGVKNGGAITCANSQWESTITAKRPQCIGPPCAYALTTEQAIQGREPVWRRGFLSSMMAR